MRRFPDLPVSEQSVLDKERLKPAKLVQNDPEFKSRVDSLGAAYQALDKTLMEKYVPFIPYEISNNRFLTSKRVGNYQNHPVYDLLIDQLWVR